MRIYQKGLKIKRYRSTTDAFFVFARHGRVLTGASPCQITIPKGVLLVKLIEPPSTERYGRGGVGGR